MKRPRYALIAVQAMTMTYLRLVAKTLFWLGFTAIAVVICAGAACAALPATSAGSLDPTFGDSGSGMYSAAFGSNYDYAMQALPQPDGRYVVAGYGGETVGAYSFGWLTRLNRDGTLDTSFNGTGRVLLGDAAVNASFYSALLQPGRIVAAGSDWFASQNRSLAKLYRYLSDGSVDASFGNGGQAAVNAPTLHNSILMQAVLDAAGRILAAGFETDAGGNNPRSFVARFTPDGQPDASFGNGGIAAFGISVPGFRVAKFAVAPSGTMTMVGYTSAPSVGAAVRLNADGTIDHGFATDGVYKLAVSGANSSALQDVVFDGGGRAIAAGWSAGGGATKAFAIAFTDAGTPDPAFGTQGFAILPAAMRSNRSIARQPDGRLVIAGIGVTGQDHPIAVRIHPDGTLDSSFGNGGAFEVTVGKGGAVSGAITVEADGKLLLPGWSYVAGGVQHSLLFRVLGAEITTPVVEFYNGVLDHYFVTADPNEAAAIDSGAAGPGWNRTGQGFKSGGPNRVCRFYGSPDVDPVSQKRRGPNSHFYTIDTAECGAVKADAGWKFESYDFNGWSIVNGACPQGTQGIKRVYNKRFAQNDSNHRYITTDALYAQMLAAGWAGEGTVFCAAL